MEIKQVGKSSTKDDVPKHRQEKALDVSIPQILAEMKAISPTKGKKTRTPWDVLHARIKREFHRVKLIGDIQFSDEEYVMLIEHFLNCLEVLEKSGINAHHVFGEAFASAVVAIGIRCYEKKGSFWAGFERQTGRVISTNRHASILQSFRDTLKAYDKALYSEENSIENVLLHGFVAEQHLDDFYEFLFTYFRIDMGRDLSLCNTSQLVNAINNDSQIREQYLRSHTHKAFELNPTGSKIRLRNLIKQMDKLFYEGEGIKLPQRRIYSGLVQWSRNSISFQKEQTTWQGNTFGRRGRKMLTSPSLFVEFGEKHNFYLFLPSLLLKASELEDSFDVSVNVTIGKRTENIPLEVLQERSILGYRTESVYCEIDPDEVFQPIQFSLMIGNSRIKVLKKLPDVLVRFFDDEGDLLPDDRLKCGMIFAFVRKGEMLSSSGLLDTIETSAYSRFDLRLETGDLVFLPNGMTLSAGTKLEEGLVEKGRLEGVYVGHDEQRIRVLNHMPFIIFKAEINAIRNTLLRVNGCQYRMTDLEYRVFDIHEANENKGVYFSLAQISGKTSGIYEVSLSVPNDKKSRQWRFVLLEGMDIHFENAPYYFETHGCVSFNWHKGIKPEQKVDILGHNVFGFAIDPNQMELSFSVETDKGFISINMPVPAFFWKSVEEDVWATNNHCEYWIDEVPKKLFVHSPGTNVRLLIRDVPDEEELSVFSFENTSSVERDAIVCDLTKLLSHLDKRRYFWHVDLEVDGRTYEFFHVGTQNYQNRVMIRPDDGEMQTVIELSYIGKNPVVFDLEFQGKLLCEKHPIGHEPMTLDIPPVEGEYRIRTYEVIESDLGFDDEYEEMKTVMCRMTDPNDFTGRVLAVQSFVDRKLGDFCRPIDHGYELQLSKKIAPNLYCGRLRLKNDFGDIVPSIRVCMKIYRDTRNESYLLGAEGEDWVDLLYDKYSRRFTMNELPGLSRVEAYMRYVLLDEERHVFRFEC
jgi:hypothetical protein